MSRLRWRCRRGTRELDLLLQDFLGCAYATLSDGERRLFEDLLDESDPDLMDWICGRADPARGDYLPLLLRLRAARVPLQPR